MLLPRQQTDPMSKGIMSFHEPLLGHVRFRKLKNINAGSFGFVQLASDLECGGQVAIKFIDRVELKAKPTLRECLNHRLLSCHPYIVTFKEIFLTQRHLAICMEFCNGGDLFDYLCAYKSPEYGKGLPEHSARHFFQQLIVAISFAHELGVANRDIKLENTLLTNNPKTGLPEVRLCDFGYSKNEFMDSRPKSVSGTPDYIAPEILQDENYDGKKADIWSCGIMLYVLLTGVLPFSRKSDERKNNVVRLQQMYPRIIAGHYNRPAHVSSQGQHLLHRMLTVDTSERITIPEIMQHPWVLANLPKEMGMLNYHLIQSCLPAGMQSAGEIEEIIHEGVNCDKSFANVYDAPQEKPMEWSK